MPLIPETARGKRLALLLTLALVFALSTAIFIAYLRFALANQPQTNDFMVFWSAARFMQQAPLHDVYDPALFDAFQRGLGRGYYAKLPFLYPPFTAFLFFPLGMLPFSWALLLWNGATLALYAAAVWQAIRPRSVAAMAAVAGIVAPATAVTLLAGQVGLLTGALTLCGVTLLGRRPLLAGALLGLLALKPQLALLPCLILLTSRQSRAFVAAVLTVALLGLASAAVFGLDAWSAWVAALGGFAADVHGSASHRQYGITVYFTLLDLGCGKYPALAIQALVAAAVLWSISRALRRGLEAPQRMLILVGLYLATPYALVYDMPAISAVCLMLLVEGQVRGLRATDLLAIACGWCVPLLLALPHVHASGSGLLVLAGLFAVIARRINTPIAEAAA